MRDLVVGEYFSYKQHWPARKHFEQTTGRTTTALGATNTFDRVKLLEVHTGQRTVLVEKRSGERLTIPNTALICTWEEQERRFKNKWNGVPRVGNAEVQTLPRGMRTF